MAVANNNGESLVATQDDVLQATKAIRDYVQASMATQDDVLSATRAVRDHFRKSLDDRLEKQMGVMNEVAARKMVEHEARYLEQVAEIKSLYEGRLEQERSFYHERLDNLQKSLEQIESTYRDRFDAFQQAREEMLGEIKELLQSFPVPQVSVNVPEQKSADIVVNVPQQQAPIVNVHAPRPRLISKSILYDEHGRPQTITEREK